MRVSFDAELIKSLVNRNRRVIELVYIIFFHRVIAASLIWVSSGWTL